jgi:hypothetical protein
LKWKRLKHVLQMAMNLFIIPSLDCGRRGFTEMRGTFVNAATPCAKRVAIHMPNDRVVFPNDRGRLTDKGRGSFV